MFLLLSTLILLQAKAAVAPLPNPALPTMQEWVHDWEIQRDFTLAVGRKMPEEHFRFRATPEEMPFGGMLLHLADALTFRVQQVSGVEPQLSLKLPLQNREEVFRYVEESFNYVIRVLPAIQPEQFARSYTVDWEGRKEATGRQILLAMFVHTAHHRAQLEVYLRLKGIAPPLYTF